jgi:hypothetical protein
LSSVREQVKKMTRIELTATEQHEVQAIMEQLRDLIDKSAWEMLEDYKSHPADTIDSIEEWRARVLQRLLAQETLYPAFRNREKFLENAVLRCTETYALESIWKCPDCGAPLERKSTIQ